MSTFVDGIGQCQVVDKSGELVDLKGHDISSLDKTGTFTWEHKSETPATLVGKILKAKKIFSKDDCENERELYFWNKCKAPYLYVMGELLDDYTASAKECAGQMLYSKNNPDKQPLLGFSIEGSELPGTRRGMVITRSIGRKVTLTQSPCNSACIAEIYEAPEQKSEVADDFASIFKSTEDAIKLFKSGEGEKIYETYLAKKESEPMKKVCKHKKLKKDDPAPSPSPAATPPEPNKANAAAMQSGAMSGGPSFGQAMSNIAGGLGLGKSDKPTWSAGKVSGDTVHYSHPSHEGSVSIQKNPSGEFHVKHQGKLAGVGGVKGSFSNPKEAKAHAQKYMAALDSGKILAPRMHNISSDALLGKSELKKVQVPGSKYPPKSQVSPTSMKTTVGGMPKFAPISSSIAKPINKALTAGMPNSAPSTRVDGAAYQTESLGKKDWKKRAKEDYENWPHKEKFESFMKARMPHLAEGEIRAIGRTLALKKSLNFEKSLKGLVFKKK